ncbi:MAG: hypothetical protein LBS38_02625 [Endomicrobium sp.]|jgi:hypothetical protein|nr:hypothetical protein [Endomicrobium sp.]MDR2399991.1 hypothetical protein [Endomicrobium sp.]
MSEEKQHIEMPPQVEKEEAGAEIEKENIENIKKEETIEKTYDIEGLLIGGAVGLGIGILISFNAIFAMEIGMFLGLIFGTRKKKKK